MQLAPREFSMDDVRKLYRVATDLVGRLDRHYKSVQSVADVFTVDMIVCRQQLHDACSQLLEADEADRYSKKCLDIMWKKIYYEVIQVARQIKKGSRWESEEKAMLWSHLTAGIGHYESLLVEIVALVDLPFEQHLPWVSKPPNFLGLNDGDNSKVNPRIVDRISHCLIALGDLNRYLNDIQGGGVGIGPPYSSMALQHYQAASTVNPRNGMPFNQMGMLLGMKGVVLDATFYYFRSMQAQNPFEGAEGNFKLLVAKTIARESGQEPVPVSLAKMSPSRPTLTHLLVFFKCCIYNEELGEDELMKAAKGAAHGLDDVTTMHELDGKTWVKLIVILAACVKAFKDKQSNLWGIKAWFFFRVGEILLARFMSELKHALEPRCSWKHLEGRVRYTVRVENQPEMSGSSNVAQKSGQSKAGADGSDAESDYSDDSADFVIEASGDEEEQDKVRQKQEELRSASAVDKMSDSEFHTPEALSPAPGAKSPINAASVDVEAVRKDLTAALEQSQLLSAAKVFHDLLRWNLDLVRTCGSHLTSVWSEVANLANVLSSCAPEARHLPDDVGFILKSRFFPDECGLFEEDDSFDGYKAMKPPPPDQFIDVHEDDGASGDQETYAAFKQRVKEVKSKLNHRDKIFLRVGLMRRLAELLCKVDATGMRYDEGKDLFYLQEANTTNVSPLAARGDSRDPSVKLCSELTKAYRMSVLAQQYIKGQVADLSRKEKKATAGSSDGDVHKLPTPPYVIPDTVAMTDHLKSIKDLLRTGEYVLIMPRPVWLGLDKLKSKSRRARDAIRWLESLTLKDDSHFRFQRAEEREKIEFVKRPKNKCREAWHMLEILECCYSVAQRGVAARRSLIGRQYEDEHQAWEMSTVLLLVGGFDVNSKDSGEVGTFLTDPEKTSAKEMTALELGRAAGVRMENIQDYYATWKKSQKGERE